MHPTHLHPQDASAEGELADDSDEEARAASRKLAETQESALAEQTQRQGSTDERVTPDGEFIPCNRALQVPITDAGNSQSWKRHHVRALYERAKCG